MDSNDTQRDAAAAREGDPTGAHTHQDTGADGEVTPHTAPNTPDATDATDAAPTVWARGLEPVSLWSVWDTDAVRAQGLDLHALENPLSVAMTSADPGTREVAEGIGAALEARYPHDTVWVLDCAQMLADRAGVGRTLLESMLRGSARRERFLERMRAMVPDDMDRESWLEQQTNLEWAPCKIVARALGLADFAATQTLLARYIRAQHGQHDATHVYAGRVLSERDHLALMHRFMQAPTEPDPAASPDDAAAASDPPPPEHLRWVIVCGLEDVVAGHAAAAPRLRRTLRELLGMLRRWKHTAVLMTLWRGAWPALMRFDPALRRFLHMPMEDADGDALARALPVHRVDPAHVCTALKAKLGVRLTRRADLDAWFGFGPDGLIAWVWPEERDDPARWITEVVPRIGRSVVGGRLVVLVPTWAWGEVHEAARVSLLQVHKNITWMPVSHATLALIAQTGAPRAKPLDPAEAPVVERLFARIKASWAEEA